MAKAPFDPLANLTSQQSAVTTINENFESMSDAIEAQLQRVPGAHDNAMYTNLDMNEYRVLNLPEPIHPHEPARHGDIQQYVDRAEDAAERSEDAAERSEEAADRSEEAWESFSARYLGVHSGPPPGRFEHGATYFDDIAKTWRVYDIQYVVSNGNRVVVDGEPIVVEEWVELPINTLASLADVDLTGISPGDLLALAPNGEFQPLSPAGDNISLDPAGTDFTSTTVQDWYEEVSARTSVGSYDIMFWAPSLLADGEVIFRLAVSREFTLPQDLQNSVAIATPPQSQSVIDINKNGTKIGEIVFQPLEGVGVMALLQTTTFELGDVLELVGPDPADTSFADVSITLSARR